MQKAEVFVEARLRNDRNEADEKDILQLHDLERPRLKEVLLALQQYQGQVVS